MGNFVEKALAESAALVREIEVEAQVNIFKIDLLKKRNAALVPKLIKRLETQVAKNQAAVRNDKKYGYKEDDAKLRTLKIFQRQFITALEKLGAKQVLDYNI